MKSPYLCCKIIEAMSQLVKKEYRLPFIMVASLFFLWGFARAIMDVLNKHFQTVMDISISSPT